MGTAEKITIIALVALLLTATVGLLVSWEQMQQEKTCQVTVVNTTKNATADTQKANPQPIPTTKKTLVFLYMSNCPGCKQMKPIIADLQAQGYSVQEINADSDPGAFARHNATSAPTIIIFRNGKETTRFGVIDEQTLISALN